MTDYLEILESRGFIAQLTDREGIKAYLSSSQTVYCGFDPTAESLHVGHLIPLMALAWLEKTGQRPIALLGGGTAMIGDPSGRTELRQLLTPEGIEKNITGIKRQIEHYLKGSAILVNNADWLRECNYIDFLREIGRHFSVNRMLTAETYKSRLEHGLSFIEFNYQLLQAYDFYHLAKGYGCLLQLGGNDQWGNIVAGIDLIRRMLSQESYGLTFPLITTSSGAKMGKTAAGAVWLDPKRTTPYEYYQFWRNTEDGDVGRFLSLFTFLPLDEIERLSELKGQELNTAKQTLALEATAITHGREAALKAADWKANMPSFELERSQLADGLGILDLALRTGACESKGEARRLVQQGGISVNDRIPSGLDSKYYEKDLVENEFIIRVGKKRYFRLVSKK